MLAEEDRREVLKQVRELLPEEDVRLSHDGEEINPVTEPMPATELGGESILCLGY